jgi:hypothetical protein
MQHGEVKCKKIIMNEFTLILRQEKIVSIENDTKWAHGSSWKMVQVVAKY